MINTNSNAMGIIFPNTYDDLVPELSNVRLMGSIPFASRYRMIDFILSSMVNCGIDNVAVIARNNYYSLMDHLGPGREWDLVRKNGGLHVFPPFAEKTGKMFNGKIDALATILGFLRTQKEKYVFVTDSNIAASFDFNEMLAAHEASGADITIAYDVQELPETVFKHVENDRGLYYTFDLADDGRITEFNINQRVRGDVNFSMNIFVIDRELLIDMIDRSSVRGLVHFERDLLAPRVDKLKLYGYRYDGYVARISDMKSYYDENMKLLDEENLDALFQKAPIHTKIRDDNPSCYLPGAKVKNVMAADGCVIAGEVENSILFRGVKIGKGAKVRNCILMQDTVIADGAVLEYTITDKNVTISEGKEMKGTDTYPAYIAKGHRV